MSNKLEAEDRRVLYEMISFGELVRRAILYALSRSFMTFRIFGVTQGLCLLEMVKVRIGEI